MRLNAAGYDAKRKDKEGWTALTRLTHHFTLGHDASTYRIAERLLELGANVNERHPDDGATPLILEASSVNTYEASGLQLLLKYGADVNAKNIDSDTFLHFLVYKKRVFLCCANCTVRVRMR